MIELTRMLNHSFRWKLFLEIVELPVNLFEAFLIAKIIDSSIAGEINLLTRNSILFLVLMMVNWGIKNFLQYKSDYVKSVEEEKCRETVWRRILDNPLYRLQEFSYGGLGENLGDDLDELVKRQTDLLPQVVAGTILSVGYLLFIGRCSWILAGIYIIMALLQIIPPLVVNKFMKINYDACRELEEKMTNHILELVKGFHILKLYSREEWWINKLKIFHGDYLIVGNKSSSALAAQKSLYRLVSNILKFGSYLLTGLFLMTNRIGVAKGVEAIYLAGPFFATTNVLFSAIPKNTVSMRAIERLKKLWPVEVGMSSVISEKELSVIRVEKMDFSWDTEPILSSVNFSLSMNDNYSISGENGAGKSSLMLLLVGALKPTVGQVFVGDTDVLQLYKNKKRWMCWLPQNDAAYKFSVEDFLSMFPKDIQERAINRMKDMKVPEALYQTAIANLSGGERKKVFLSLAFAEDTPWLFLDEPTNSLDADAKQVLQKWISLRKGVVMISHDSDMLISFDKQLIVSEGRVTVSEV